MAKEYAINFYRSTAWKKCRKSFIGSRRSVDGGLCQHCMSRIGYIVDHIEEITPQNISDTDITLNHENLQFLCLECHNKKTFQKNFSTRENLFFDENGQLREVPPLKK